MTDWDHQCKPTTLTKNETSTVKPPERQQSLSCVELLPPLLQSHDSFSDTYRIDNAYRLHTFMVILNGPEYPHQKVRHLSLFLKQSIPTLAIT